MKTNKPLGFLDYSRFVANSQLDGWEVKRLKYFVKLIKTGSTPPTAISEYYGDDVLWFTPDDLTDKLIVENSARMISNLALDDNAARLFPGGTILMVGIGTVGRVALCNKPCSSNQQINAIIPNNSILPKYLLYYLGSCSSVIRAFANITLLAIINQEKTKQIPIIAPNLEEQNVIVNYLDNRIAKIDKLINKNNELLNLLNEKRISLISNAVTGKINITGETIEYKETGVQWLGDVPKHWGYKKLKYCVNIINEKIEAEDADNYVGLENISSWTGKIIKDVDTKIEGAANRFCPNDILFGKLRPYLAKVWLANIEGCCSTEAIVLRAGKDVTPLYLSYCLLSEKFIDLVNSSTFGSKMPRANWDFIGSVYITLPPLKEQDTIMFYLQKELDKIDNLVDEIKNAIYKLQEYKISLISTAVTGKIDLRNWKPKSEVEFQPGE